MHPHFEGRIRKLRPLGAAPDAQLVVQSTYSGSGRPLGGLPKDLGELLRIPYEEDGARVHSNSWILSTPLNRYELCCRAVDDFIHRHRDLVVVFAVGNEGRDEDGPQGPRLVEGTIKPPSLAKNCLSVGACESRRLDRSKPWRESFRHQLRTDGVRQDGFADDSEGIAPISGLGPAFNGRLKPDLVAPGTAILSARSRRADRVPETWGSSGDSAYFYLGGSSPAAALVAGCAAVAREFLEERLGGPPSAALVKALLINGARDLTGQLVPSEAPETPNVAEGWGRVDLQASVAPEDPIHLEFLDEDEGRLLVEPEDEIRLSFPVAVPGHPARITLVWTDPPGEELQSDLDLIVLVPNDSTELHGNMPPGDSGFDRINNVEQITLPEVEAGILTVIVRAHRVEPPGQTFALIIRAAQ